MSEPDRPTNIDTGGGGFVGGGVHAGRDVNLGPITNQISWEQGVVYTPLPPPPPDDLPLPGPLPPGSYLPYDRNERFTGREAQLLELAALLLPRPGDGDAPPAAVVITAGIGGVGKSHLAVEFAYRYGRYFHGVHWVSAENPEAVDSAVATCGMRMGLHPAFGGLAMAEQVALTERAWAGPEARLILFDNCEEEGLLWARRPKGGGARVLATSRRERWDGAAARVRPLGPMSQPEGVVLLQRHLAEGEGRPPRTDVAVDDLRDVAAELGELPLALRLAGAYLRRYRTLPAADYLVDLRRVGPLVHRSLHDKPDDRERSVAATFRISFNRLQPDDPTDAAAVALLARAACFAPGEPLPEWLLRAAMEQTMATPSPDDSPQTAEEDEWRPGFEDGLERLLELGLLEPVEEDTYRLHRLLAGFVIDAMAAGMMDGARGAVERAVYITANRQNKAGYPAALREWEIHLRHVVDTAFEHETEQTAELCNEMGYYLRMSGDLAGARPYYERALAIRERVLGPEHPNTATSLNNLGYLLQAMGDLAGARPYFERALAIRERVLGPEHPDTASSLNNLATLCYYEGRFREAADFMRRALAIWEKVLGPDHPDTRMARDSLKAIEAKL